MNEDYEKLKAMIDKKNSVYVVHGEQVVNEQSEYVENAQEKIEKGKHRIKQIISGVVIVTVVAGSAYVIGNKVKDSFAAGSGSSTIEVEEQSDNTRDLINVISEEYGKTPRDIYSEYVKWVELNQNEGLQSQNYQESYMMFLNNYDQNLNDVEHGQLGYESNAQGGRRV